MKHITILGVRVDCLSGEEISKRCEDWLTDPKGFHQIVTVNPEFVMEAQDNKEFCDVINSSALATADGIGLLMSAFLFYKKRLYRLTGVDLTLKLAEMCARLGKRVYLLGGGSQVAQKVENELKKLYPDLIIAGVEEGITVGLRGGQDQVYDGRSLAICKRISDSNTDVLLVAFGAPKQDLWIARYAKDIPTVRIAVGVGGTFDYLSGTVPRAPKWMRSIGFEWTYRLIAQPYRWRRIITAVIRFPLAVLFSKRDALTPKP